MSAVGSIRNFGGREGRKVFRLDLARKRLVGALVSTARGEVTRIPGTEGGPQDQVRGKGSPSRVPYIYNRGAFRVK